MTDEALERIRLLNRRLELVSDISALNSEALKGIQQLGAVEMEILRLELEAPKATDREELARNLRAAEVNAEAIRAAHAECEDRIEAVENDIDEIDRMLACIGKQ